MLNAFFRILDSIDRFLLRRKKDRATGDRVRTRAIESILAAVTETEAYTYDRRQGLKIDRTREMSLSRLWGKAAIDVKRVDSRLSRIAALKSFEWANPDLMKDPEHRRLSTRLSTLRRQCEWLLAN